MNQILKEHFINLYNSSRMGHAFLICNTNYDNLREDLIDILSDYFFDGEVNIENNPDIYIIRPENGKIVKEEILMLQEVFKTKSQVNKNRIYIIDGVEKMNDYASNSLLKFLEEPESDIYAFLVTSNLDKVLPTIKSRCQVLLVDSNSSFSLDEIPEDIINISIQFVLTYEKYKEKSIAYIYKFINKKEEKEKIKSIINVMKYFYYDSLNYKLLGVTNYFSSYMNDIKKISEINNENQLINKLIILNKSENMLEYNLNLNLFLDKLIIEMEEAYNE